MKTSTIKPEQGSLLISEPYLRDYYFRRSVILLAEHNSDGSFGLIINKPLDIKLNEVILDFPDFNTNIYIGGPVQTDRLFILHSLGRKITESHKIMEGLYWGGKIETIKSMIEDKKISSKDIRFFIGYSGWDKSQLEKEMEALSWVVSKTKPNNFLFESPEDMWKNLLKTMGQNYAMWVYSPIDPLMN
ncbi:MAG: YqgE/AlgH family protein [Bacteroidetes bacterium]|nr:YqgE/AlgH family protein [Bacteroidota bacterium]